MPEEAPRPVGRERRGVDPAVLAFLHTLIDDYAENHRREHEALIRTYRDALALAADRLEDMDKSIREHYDTILVERDARYSERFNASQTALEQAAAAAKESVITALKTAREETNKTEANWVKNADATFVKLEQLQTALASVVPRDESDKSDKENDRRFNEIVNRITVLEAAKAGKTELLPWVIAAVAVAGFLFQFKGG